MRKVVVGAVVTDYRYIDGSSKRLELETAS